MYVVIIGLGEVGRHLLRVLEDDGHDIVAVDQHPASVQFVEEHHDVMTLTGYGASEDILDQAGVHRADLLVAVTDHDEVNLIAALAGKQLGAKKVIARTQGNEWARTRMGVRYGLLGGIDVVINPSVLVAQELVKIARSHGAVEVIDLAQDRIELVQVEMSEKSRLAHKPISALGLKNTLIAAIVRRGELLVPGGSDVLMPDDRIYLLGRPSDVRVAEDRFTSKRETRRAWIAGGGVTGETIARDLADEHTDVLIVESHRERAEQLSGALDRVTVLHGDATDSRLLKEEEIGTYDLFAAVTSDDELNLMAALLAQRMGAVRTAAIVHRPDYMPIYKKLGIDIVVSPRTVASDHILRYCRTSELKSLTVLQNGQAEVLEMTAEAGCRAIGPLSQLGWMRQALIGAIVHDDQVIIPEGKDEIQEGDTVIVLTATSARTTVEKLFQPGAR